MQRKLDLRSGTPVWSAYRSPSVPIGRLARDVRADVLIVGMGIGGATMAEALARDGLSVICIDRRGPLQGSTAATTALVQFEIDQPLTKLSKMIGGAAAGQAWRRSRLALFNLQGRIAELCIRCSQMSTQSLYLAGTTLGPTDLRKEAEARRRAGIGASFLVRAKLRDEFGIDRGGAILSHDNLALDPRKLTAGLLLAALNRKARFYAPAEAMAIEHNRLGVAVVTRLGPTITARHLILTTGYELLDVVPAVSHKVISTWAIATRQQPAQIWPGAAMIWEASDPYLYVRATADGRVICGGEDENFTDEERRNALTDKKAAQLSKKLERIFPLLDTTAEFAWSGSFGAIGTGLPIIGALPDYPRIHAVMGYGGNGILFSQIASEIVSASIKGGEDTDADLFAFKA
ncbi:MULTISPECIES: FAD-binding oxidoreductase [unclassified Mesorhizobium]|uniref:NAD(P)/FAD-dependent oxidoreductase n=1 Tax=unclassified Mesorhizobium TaxID=325217 RepID=UPI000FCCA40E|nr:MULTISPECIES: FAD-binding oxidoreductase [unclassified Mesorhizobium]TGP18090.1 FAD-binding oxidoreductase [Mesorhizobium sp. M1D.F.Ca.ET.231.01.1.1]TGP25392.1 FAD-binding oxidoreductase [Mesorhizobium sp. M1D.F.Ca.ET.234.01.1.1]TGS37858.1 FAD-binding oxidoreductase [Mesorhizobium sp. M1D.F.Ca.ET.184.01.1.1]TGS58211.1 FAD-binding oxidoreductase [Mesorhizobium sp. M1D.F.Ca.ET.183.01.1.1]